MFSKSYLKILLVCIVIFIVLILIYLIFLSNEEKKDGSGGKLEKNISEDNKSIDMSSGKKREVERSFENYLESRGEVNTGYNRF